MPNDIVLYILFLSPFIVQFSIYFTEWKLRKSLRQLPKARRRLFNFDLSELSEKNIPYYSILLRSYVFLPFLSICFFAIALGAEDTYDSAVHNPYVLYFLVAVVLANISKFILLKKIDQFNTTPIFIAFSKENSDIPFRNNKQRSFRTFLNYFTLALSLMNIIIFFVLG
ncbi:MAG: hypothetical protein LIR10_02525 [Bacillota bacterium]|nr:hypothetical protein [Bacillota bacterium]